MGMVTTYNINSCHKTLMLHKFTTSILDEIMIVYIWYVSLHTNKCWTFYVAMHTISSHDKDLTRLCYATYRLQRIWAIVPIIPNSFDLFFNSIQHTIRFRKQQPSNIRQESRWRQLMEVFSALLAIYVGNSPVTHEFPAKKPMTRSFDVFCDLFRINCWVNNRRVGDLRRHRIRYDVTVMSGERIALNYSRLTSCCTCFVLHATEQ